MMSPLEASAGKIVGSWGLHYHGFHNPGPILHLLEDGRVDSINSIKLWAVSGPNLFLIDDKLIVCMVLQFRELQEGRVPILQGQVVSTSHACYLRRCGEAHPIINFNDVMPKAHEINFLQELKNTKDFSVEIEPRTEVVAPLEEDLTYNATQSNAPILSSQPVSLPPIYFHVLNQARIISGFVVEASDGRCLMESSSLSECNTVFDRVPAYVDYEKKLQFYYSIEAKDKIEGLCIYIENGSGMDHWLMQSLPTIYILDWLEKAGVDFSKVKFLTRRGFFNEDQKAAYKAAGWLDKMPESSIVDLSKLSPAVAVEKLIYPSFMWIIIAQSCPQKFNLSLYPLSQKVRATYEKIKHGVVVSAPNTNIYPLVFIIRKKETLRKRLLNEMELLEALKPLGFVGVDLADLNFEEKVQLFDGARVVVATRGAGLTFSLFCRPGTHIHELCHDTNNFLYDHHKVLAHMMDLKFSCVLYPTLSLPDDGENPPNNLCFTVNIEEVVANIRKILARPELSDLKNNQIIAA